MSLGYIHWYRLLWYNRLTPRPASVVFTETPAGDQRAKMEGKLIFKPRVVDRPIVRFKVFTGATASHDKSIKWKEQCGIAP